jgi:hypothetical protein
VGSQFIEMDVVELISNWIVRVIVCIENKSLMMKRVIHVYIMSKIVEHFVWIGLILIT